MQCTKNVNLRSTPSQHDVSSEQCDCDSIEQLYKFGRAWDLSTNSVTSYVELLAQANSPPPIARFHQAPHRDRLTAKSNGEKQSRGWVLAREPGWMRPSKTPECHDFGAAQNQASLAGSRTVRHMNPKVPAQAEKSTVSVAVPCAPRRSGTYIALSYLSCVQLLLSRPRGDRSHRQVHRRGHLLVGL